MAVSGYHQQLTAVIVLATTKMLAQDPPHWVTETIPVVFAYCQPQFTTESISGNSGEDWGPGTNWACLSWRDANDNVPGTPYKEAQTTSGIQMRQKLFCQFLMRDQKTEIHLNRLMILTQSVRHTIVVSELA